LLLFRKAADLLDPEVKDLLAQVWALISDAEVKLNRPVAARAALTLAHHCDPADEGFRKALDSLDDEQSPFPLSARRAYTFLAPAASLPAEKRSAWDQALARAATGKMTDAARAFAELTQLAPENGAGWFNLGLVRAWLGDNPGALEALDRYVGLETDTTLAAAAWSLGEALRYGEGMEDYADVLEHGVMYQIKDPERISHCLQDWQTQRSLLVTEARQDQPVLTALVLDRPVSLTASPSSDRPPRLGAYLLIAGDRMRLWNTNQESFNRIRDQLRQKAGPALGGEVAEVQVPPYRDVLTAALVFPVDSADQAEQRTLVERELVRYFEEVWPEQPLRTLNGKRPIEAAGQPVLQKKLAGVVQFLAECAGITGQPYDFDRLRRKLGLLGGVPAAAAPGASLDLASLGAAELAQVAVDPLSDDQLEQAYQAALKKEARDVAGKFAQALVSRPARPERPDRFPWYSHLVQLALGEGNTGGALDYLNEGEKHDCEHNEGRRRNEYELRRGQIHAKRGEAEQAQDVFERLIARVPAELKFRGSAAEAMLSARQGSRALAFAESGLAKAREQSNRDLEQYFLELADAARRQG